MSYVNQNITLTISAIMEAIKEQEKLYQTREQLQMVFLYETYGSINYSLLIIEYLMLPYLKENN